jgi:hypothetical protein
MAATQCTWLPKAQKCISSPSHDFLQTVCGSGCVSRMAGALSATKTELATEALFLHQIVCAKEADGSYCMPLIADELESISEQGFTQNATGSLCNNGPKGRCFRRIWSGSADFRRRDAEDSFIVCATDAFDTLPRYLAEPAIVLRCLKTFIEEIEVVQQIAGQADVLCVRNSDGDYCSALLSRYSSRTCLWNVLECKTLDWIWDPAARRVCQCPSNCVMELEAIIQTLGCCVGTLQSIYGKIINVNTMDPPILPTLDSFATMAPFHEAARSPSATSSPPPFGFGLSGQWGFSVQSRSTSPVLGGFFEELSIGGVKR